MTSVSNKQLHRGGFGRTLLEASCTIFFVKKIRHSYAYFFTPKTRVFVKDNCGKPPPSEVVKRAREFTKGHGQIEAVVCVCVFLPKMP